MYSSFYKEIYFKSLLPFEIIDFRKKNNFFYKKNESLYYLEFWKKNICKNASEASFEKYCHINHLSKNDIFFMTSPISNYKEEVDLPFWLNTLEKILNTIDGVEMKNDEDVQEIPFYHLLFPFTHYFVSMFNANLVGSNMRLPKKKILKYLTSTLYKDLYLVSHSVLLDEFSKFIKEEKKKRNEVNTKEEDFYYKKFIYGILSDKFNNLFLKYPMLARKLTTKTYRYIQFITNVFVRFETDKHDIRGYFNEDVDEIVKLNLNLGDQHHGESTVIIEFKNSYKIVYKPTSVSITTAYNGFINWINKNLIVGLKTFKVLDRKEYGWLEYVENLECTNENEVKAYYERAGILTGITYFLNARDYHYENIIASGKSPVLIDHETVIGSDIKSNNTNKNTGTVLESLLLPTTNNDRKIKCGFGSFSQLQKNGVSIKIKNSNKDHMQMIPQLSHQNSLKMNIPKLNGKLHHLRNYQSEFKIGFRKLYNFVLRNKNFLISQDSPLWGFKNFKIRFIFRPTSVYGKILLSLNTPEYLSDSIKYGLRIELLARAFLKNENYIPILESEREQIYLDDIPVFYTNTLSKNIILTNKAEVDIFEQNAIKSIKNKIKNASTEDYQEQMNLIEEVIIL